MAELLFYKKVAVLDKVRHLNYSLKNFENLNFAANIQSVLLTGSEYIEASKEYPIVFIKAPDGSLMSVALLGFRTGQNLYVNKEGRWNARYIPAYVRRYPFIFSDSAPEQLVVCIDEECPEFNNEGKGVRLFDDTSAPSPFMNNMIQFMQDYQTDFVRTRAFVENLQKLNVLKENTISIKLGNGEEFTVNGVLIVDEALLNALNDEQLLKLARNGELGRIHAHLISLSNLKNFAILDVPKPA